MDVQNQLRQLPEPDPAAPDRIWARFQASTAERAPSRSWLPRVSPFGLLGFGGAAMATAALAWIAIPQDTPRQIELDASGATEVLTWSEQVQFEFSGQGAVSGTSKDVVVDWDKGRLAVQVAPQTGTELVVRTEEARIEVVGTAFTVERDLLGVTVTVTHGKVRVDCTEGWSGSVVSETGSQTCLPVRPALLLGRADALLDLGADPETLLQTLDLGLERAEVGSAVRAELQVRRMHARTALGQTSEALADADGYLAGEQTGRTVEVQRFASRIALHRGCERALRYLEPLRETGNAEDAVLLAECISEREPADARALLVTAIAELETEWQARARNALDSLGTDKEDR